MLTPRNTVATAVILTVGITAAWLASNDEPVSDQIVTPAPRSVERSLSLAEPVPAHEEAQPSDYRGGAISLVPAVAQAQAELRQKRTQAMAAFDSWAERYARSTPEERANLVKSGLALARERRAFMTDLIKNDPRAAIEAADAMSPLARKELPTEVAEHVERMVSAKGDLEVWGVTGSDENSYRRYAHIGNDTFTAYTYGKRLAPIPETNTPLIGVSLPAADTVQVNGQAVEHTENLLALREDKFRVLSKAEVALQRQTEPEPAVHHCPVSGNDTNTNSDETGLDVGGEVVWLCKNGHIAPYVQTAAGALVETSGVQKTALAGGPGEGAGSFPSVPSGWTTGSKTFIAMPVKFSGQASVPFTTTSVTNAVSPMCSRLGNWSYGRVSFTYTVTPILTLPHTEAEYAGYSNPEGSMMSDAIAAANKKGYNASGKSFRSVVFSSSSIGTYSGLGQITGQNTWIKDVTTHTFSHEVGHNLSLPHANSWKPTTSNPIGAGSHGEYNGYYNSMSYTNWPASAYDTMMRFYIRWLTANETHYVTTNGTYRIYDPEVTSIGSGRKYTIRISKQAGQYYFVEFRPRATALADNESVDTTTQNGIRILRTNGSELIDVTTSTSGTWDAALTVGNSFTDPDAGITISPTVKGGSGSDQYMDVQVTFNTPTLFSGGVYEVQPQCAPGLCLDVSGGQDADGANVQIWTGWGGAAQQWKLEDEGNGTWELIPLCAAGRRLDVNGGGSANGANVDIWGDYSVNNERWQISSTGDGYFELIPQNATGSRLDVANGSNSDGTNVQQWQSNGSSAQRWRLLATGPQNGAIYTLEPQCAPGKRLDVAGGADADGTNVQIWSATGGTAQQWQLQDQGNGLFELIPQCATSRRLDVSGWGTSNGTNIQIWQDGDSDPQRWSVVGTGDGYYELVPKLATGSRCDVNGAGNADGTNVQLWQSYGNSAQRWRLFRN